MKEAALGDRATLKKIRALIGLFIAGLVGSGLTAFPLLHELRVVTSLLGVPEGASPEAYSGLTFWLVEVRQGLEVTYSGYPFMAYGTDWLAFGHLMIALFFVGPWIDPRRNVWVIQAGLIACACVVPLALICGALRGIPFYWRLIDCSFGGLGAIPLWMVFRLTRRLDRHREPL